VDVYAVHPPAPWLHACRNLLVTLFSDILDDAVDEVLYGGEPVGGFDPSTPEGWDNSTGEE
jgi:hypothetical protein